MHVDWHCLLLYTIVLDSCVGQSPTISQPPTWQKSQTPTKLHDKYLLSSALKGHLSIATTYPCLKSDYCNSLVIICASWRESVILATTSWWSYLWTMTHIQKKLTNQPLPTSIPATWGHISTTSLLWWRTTTSQRTTAWWCILQRVSLRLGPLFLFRGNSMISPLSETSYWQNVRLKHASRFCTL